MNRQAWVWLIAAAVGALAALAVILALAAVGACIDAVTPDGDE